MIGLRIALAILIVVAAAVSDSGYHRTETSTPAAHIHAGAQVQKHYNAYLERLNAYHDLLSRTLSGNAPELYSNRSSPEALQRGYQILPRIIADPHITEQRPLSIWYSWPWTNTLIARELTRISRAEATLKRAVVSESLSARHAYEKLWKEYQQLRAAQHNIDAHIQYNFLWQAAIARDRPGYDRETQLHNMVVERRAIHNALEATSQASARTLSRWSQVSGLDGIAIGKQKLMEREKRLARAIEQATGFINVPDFVDIEQRDSTLWIVHVTVYTDIEDLEFVARFKDAVETIWRVRQGPEEFRVELVVSSIPVTELYNKQKGPEPGALLDLELHLASFPANGAILTTGGVATHVYRGAIILGADDITPRVLAHEFGHILGFRDNYFRGYSDLGDKGFNIVETVAETTDIMGDPLRGSVLRSHFERIIKAGAERVMEGRQGSGSGKKRGVAGSQQPTRRPARSSAYTSLPPRDAATIATITTKTIASPISNATVESNPSMVPPAGPGAPAGPRGPG